MKIIKTIFRVISYILTAVLLVLLLSNVYLIAARSVFKDPAPMVFGYASAVVISGSMEPTIHIDDMVIFKSQDKYYVDDIVTFTGNSSYVTHRIIEATETGFITKGDANNAADSDELSPDRIIGRVVFVIPNIGKAMTFLQSPLGLVLILLMTVVVLELPNFIRGKERESEEKTSDEKENE